MAAQVLLDSGPEGAGTLAMDESDGFQAGHHRIVNELVRLQQRLLDGQSPQIQISFHRPFLPGGDVAGAGRRIGGGSASLFSGD